MAGFSIGDLVVPFLHSVPNAAHVAVIVERRKCDKSGSPAGGCAEYGYRWLIANGGHVGVCYSELSNAEDLDAFGVVLSCDDGRYWCEQIKPSIATQLDGSVREWQGNEKQVHALSSRAADYLCPLEPAGIVEESGLRVWQCLVETPGGTIAVPEGAECLGVFMSPSGLRVRMLVDVGQTPGPRQFECYRTGGKIPKLGFGRTRVYVGSVADDVGEWHVFEVVERPEVTE